MAVSTTPSTAAASALPMLRKNWKAAVAMPRSPHGTDTCTAINIGVVLIPKPAPDMSAAKATTTARSPTLSFTTENCTSKSRSAPTTTIARPSLMSGRKPVRLISLPLMALAMGQPIERGAITRPAWMGVPPHTPCARSGT